MPWDAKIGLGYVPEEVRQHFKEDAGYLHHELETNRLRIILIPAPDPQHYNHEIRAVDTRNPKWYSEIYWEHFPIRRDLSLRSLRRIHLGEDKDFTQANYKYRYDMLYRDFIFERLTKGYEEMGYKIPPLKSIRTFFDLPIIDTIEETICEEIPF